jgi:adenosylcobinamide-phosphate synthase
VTEWLEGAGLPLVILIADLALGDPRWLPHPVRGFGSLVVRLEGFWRRRAPLLGLRAAGAFFALTAIVLAVVVVWASLQAVSSIAWLSWLVAVYWGYSLLAVRDLDLESGEVIAALHRRDLADARTKLGRIVGRDTGQLEEPEILRAVIETVSESMNDGIVAPLFYLGVGGPAGMAIYKAANTLDSMVGYKSDRYREFGWSAARLDDLLNLIPARFTALLIWIATALLGLDLRRSVRAVVRDASLQPSPNAGFPEAAMAGALRVRLGGMNYYQGRPSWKPPLGDGTVALTVESFIHARRLLYLTAFLAALLSVVLSQWRNA